MASAEPQWRKYLTLDTKKLYEEAVKIKDTHPSVWEWFNRGVTLLEAYHRREITPEGQEELEHEYAVLRPRDGFQT